MSRKMPIWKPMIMFILSFRKSIKRVSTQRFFVITILRSRSLTINLSLSTFPFVGPPPPFSFTQWLTQWLWGLGSVDLHVLNWNRLRSTLWYLCITTYTALGVLSVPRYLGIQHSGTAPRNNSGQIYYFHGFAENGVLSRFGKYGSSDFTTNL